MGVALLKGFQGATAESEAQELERLRRQDRAQRAEIARLRQEVARREDAWAGLAAVAANPPWRSA